MRKLTQGGSLGCIHVPLELPGQLDFFQKCLPGSIILQQELQKVWIHDDQELAESTTTLLTRQKTEDTR